MAEQRVETKDNSFPSKYSMQIIREGIVILNGKEVQRKDLNIT